LRGNPVRAAAIAQRVGRLQQRIRRQIGNDEAVVLAQRRGRLGDIVAILEPDFLQRKVLVEEFSGRIVVLDRQPRAGDAVVLRGLLDQGQFRFDAGAAEIADADLDRFCRERLACDHAQTDCGDQPSDHASSQKSPSP
jgi:hypothetical protein